MISSPPFFGFLHDYPARAFDLGAPLAEENGRVKASFLDP